MKANKSRKGFTLMELIIVLAIMSILLAIIIPSWGYFIRRARERSAESRAKVVFNAAQTEITKINSRERQLWNIANDSTADTLARNKANDEMYINSGDFYFYCDGKNGGKCLADGTAAGTVTAQDKAFAKAINNITGGEGVYKIYVKNYIVQSVIYSDLKDGRYKGTYPKRMDDLSDTNRASVRSGSVQSATMTNFTL